MTSPDHDVDPFIRALQEDLPSGADERRIRARLLAAGIGVGTGICASGAAAAGASAVAKVGFLPNLAALSWGTKLGVAGVAIAAATAVPLAVELTSNETPDATRPAAPTASDPLPPARALPAIALPETPAASTDIDIDEARAAEPEPVAAPPPEPRSLAPRRLSNPRSAPVQSGREPAPAAPTSENTAAAAAFPNIEAPSPAPPPADQDRPPAESEPVEVVPPSTLGEETAIMDRALSALGAGQRDRALQWLGEHARRFPNGKLARERERALQHARSLPAASGSSAH